MKNRSGVIRKSATDPEHAGQDTDQPAEPQQHEGRSPGGAYLGYGQVDLHRGRAPSN